MTDRYIVHLNILLFDAMPIVWRRVSFPVNGTLKAPHAALQAAMGCDNIYMWEFVSAAISATVTRTRRGGKPPPKASDYRTAGPELAPRPLYL